MAVKVSLTLRFREPPSGLGLAAAACALVAARSAAFWVAFMISLASFSRLAFAA